MHNSEAPSIHELFLPHNLATSPHSQILMQYVRFLKGLYCSRPFPTYFKFPIVRQHAKHFIKLALVDSFSDPEMTQSSVLLQIQGNVDEIHKKKRPFSIDEVGRLKDGSSANYILIEGAPGIGKTTFAWELCQEWAKGHLLNQWSVVLLIQMRDKRVRNAKTLKDIFYHPETYINDNIYRVVQNTDGQGVLLLFEGYDEVSESQKSEDSIFQKLLRREFLPQAALVVSSRPIASKTLCEQFLGQIQQHIEILGFTQENIEAYISSACSENAALKEDLEEYLSCHPFIFSIMYIPLYCSIVTELYLMHWRKDNKELVPKTLTETYSTLVMYLLQRHFDANSSSAFQNHKMHSLMDLPQEMYWKVMDVCKVAAKGIHNHQYIFDTLECNSLGLLNAVQDLYANENSCISYSFLHQTLQEFLAAFYHSQSDSVPVSQVLQQDHLFPVKKYLQGEHRKESNTTFHWPVLLFIAGLTKLKDIPLNLLRSFPDDKFSKSEIKFHPAIFQLLFETQSSSLVFSLFSNDTYMPTPWEMTPLDWFVCGYCITNSSQTSLWRIEYEEDAIQTSLCLNMLAKGMRYSAFRKKGGTVKIISLLGGSKLLQCLISIIEMRDHINELSELVLGGELTPGRKTDTMLGQVSKAFPYLKRLQVSTDSTFSTWHSLFACLQSLEYLDTLQIEAVFTEVDTILIAQQLKHCSALKHLYVWCNEDSCGIMPLISAASYLVANHLHTFSLQRCSLLGSAMNIFAESLKLPHCSLRVLKFHEVSVSPDDFSTFASAIATNKSITSLSLNDCGVTDASIICLATVINENTTLEEIELTEWYMNEETELFFKEAIKKNPSIMKLKLAQRNVFTDIPQELQEYLGLYQ